MLFGSAPRRAHSPTTMSKTTYSSSSMSAAKRMFRMNCGSPGTSGVRIGRIVLRDRRCPAGLRMLALVLPPQPQVNRRQGIAAEHADHVVRPGLHLGRRAGGQVLLRAGAEHELHARVRADHYAGADGPLIAEARSRESRADRHGSLVV